MNADLRLKSRIVVPVQDVVLGALEILAAFIAAGVLLLCHRSAAFCFLIANRCTGGLAASQASGAQKQAEDLQVLHRSGSNMIAAFVPNASLFKY
jgi:hypothetical protein